MFILYDFLFIVFAVLYFPYLLIRGKWHSGFKIRFGYLDEFAKKLDNRKRIWIHAVSVGEVLAVGDLLKKLKERFPEHSIICSTVTKTGNQLAQEQFGNDAIVVFAPLDLSWIVKKFVKVIGPSIYISTETEIWPNLYSALHKASVPIIQINGRISDRSFKGYRRIRFLTKKILSCVGLFCMQSPLDAERIECLGAVKEKIRIVGNLKFDNILTSTDVQKEDLGFQENEDLLIAGSTHPGEEEILIDAYRQLIMEFPNLRLVLVPRHVERVGSIIDLVKRKGYPPARFSDIQASKGKAKSIMVVDTIGHLRSLYSLAKIVFIGKTLRVGGGQNMIESACLGKPTIVGPMTQNFKDAVNIFLKSDSIIQVANPEELEAEIRNLLVDEQRAQKIGDAARKTVEQYQGATSKTLDAISELLS